mmetsp:Transcript_129383/g.335485  ORF Transcript_129383/g.335485 Transcript_129383/m.335485 type:complete len:567 (-) Transcript_129383:381-2081(-)
MAVPTPQLYVKSKPLRSMSSNTSTSPLMIALVAFASFSAGVLVSRPSASGTYGTALTSSASKTDTAAEAVGGESNFVFYQSNGLPVHSFSSHGSPSMTLLVALGSCTCAVYLAAKRWLIGNNLENGSPTSPGASLESQDMPLPWDPLNNSAEKAEDKEVVAPQLRRDAEIRHGHHISVIAFGVGQPCRFTARSACSTECGEVSHSDSAEVTGATSDDISPSASGSSSEEENDEEVQTEGESEQETDEDDDEENDDDDEESSEDDRELDDEAAKAELEAVEEELEAVEEELADVAVVTACSSSGVEEPSAQAQGEDEVSVVPPKCKDAEPSEESQTVKTIQLAEGWSACCFPSGRMWSDDVDDLPAGPPGVFHLPRPQAPAVPQQTWSRAISAESTQSFAASSAAFDWTRAMSGESVLSSAYYSPSPAPHQWSRAISAESVQSYASRASRASIDPDDKDMTLRSIMQALETVDASRVLQVRRIKQLGFGSPAALREHCLQFGQVERVLVSHSRAQLRLRPASLGFIVMVDPAGVQAVLAAGKEQLIGEVVVKLGAFERQATNVDEEK